MTGHITVNGEQMKIVCFTNGYKKEEKHPDWRVLISKPKDATEERQGYDRHEPAAAKYRDPEQQREQEQEQEDTERNHSSGIDYPKDDINPDDIPF